MEKDNYIDKLRTSLLNYLSKLIESNGSLVIPDGKKIISTVYQLQAFPKLDNIQYHELLSGKELDINVDGNISIMEKIEGGSQSLHLTFSVRPARVKFNTEEVIFEILGVDGLMFFKVP